MSYLEIDLLVMVAGAVIVLILLFTPGKKNKK